MRSTRTPLCKYNYDALDRLIYQHQPNAATHQRFYCKSRLATEIHGTLGHSIIQHDDLLLAEQRREGSSIDTTLLATDLQRSVLHTLKQGAAPHPIAYSPYGHRPALGGLLSLLGFNGERPDPLTGHYLLGNGYRAFNPVLMRFHCPDILSPFGGGGLNPYSYCLGDPIGKTDPTGHIPRWIARIIGPRSRTIGPIKYFDPPLKTKRGYTSKEGSDALRKIIELKDSARKLNNNARLKVLSEDSRLAFSFDEPYKPKETLLHSTYKTFRETDTRSHTVFDFLDRTQAHNGGSNFQTTRLLAQDEIASFRPLFEEVNSFYHTGNNVLGRLSFIYGHNEQLSIPYSRRMKSITDPTAQALKNEALGIRKEVFKPPKNR